MTKMVSVQIRFPADELRRIDSYVEKGEYSSRSDFIRDAVRKMEMIRALESMRRVLNEKNVTFEDLLEGGDEIRAILLKEMFGVEK
ncbi:MAG: ribbon-helix-helix domain-containing protein [Thermoplasmatota archaeon]